MNNSLTIIQQGIASGDERCLSELYHLFNKKLLHFSKSITRSLETSEEIVEDVFVKLWTNKSQILSIENLGVYLYVAVKNRSLNSLSHKSKELINGAFEDLDFNIGAVTNDPCSLMITNEMLQRMQQAVDNLSPRCKMIFKLIREDGLKYKEVAEILNISVNTIDVQMAIAVKKICTALSISRPTRSILKTLNLFFV